MKKALIVGVIAALMVGAIGITAWAGGGGPKFGGAGKGGLLKGLNLTADQQSKILAVQQDFQKETLPLRQDLQKKKLELRQLWDAEQLNQAAIDAKNKEITAIQIQLVQKSRAMMEKVKKLLTADQLKQWESFQGKDRPGMGFGRGRMMGFGCGMGVCGAFGA
ncbi:MAG: periplasmic heavy metal sensor [Firmicutes bacterium]|nr:periplasmic heavy metal sensor [Bacillota bacterium]